MAEIAVVNSTELPAGSSTSSDDAKKKFRAVRQGARPSRFQRLLFLIDLTLHYSGILLCRLQLAL